MSRNLWQSSDNRAVAVLRVSTKTQKDNTSHDTQESDIHDYCLKNDLNLVEIFRLAESAKDSEQRFQYHSAMKYARSKKIKHVLFYMFDRETRNLTDNEQNEKDVRRGLLVLHYVRDEKVIHRDSPDSDFMMRDFQAVSNKQFVRNLSAKVQDATLKKAETGWYPGCLPPLGYAHYRPVNESGRIIRRAPTTIIQDPNTANLKLVQSEFKLRSQGLTIDQIVEKNLELNLVPVSMVRSYRKNAVAKRLNNIFYRGKFSWKGQVYNGKHPIIIPQDVLEKIDGKEKNKSNFTKKQQLGVFGGGVV